MLTRPLRLPQYIAVRDETVTNPAYPNGPWPRDGHDYGHQLLERISGFSRYLRRVGLPVSLAQTMDLVRSLEAVGLRREDFKLAARTTLVTGKEGLSLFDRAFDLYWRRSIFEDLGENSEWAECVDDSAQTETQDGDALPSPRQSRGQEERVQREPGMGLRQLQEGDAEGDVEPDFVLTYSGHERLCEKDFAQFTPEELQTAKLLMNRIPWQISVRRSRRTLASSRGPFLDPRRSLRANLKYGEPVELARRKRKTKPRQLVVICDISGSMDRYSRLLLQFLHTVEHGVESPVEVFVFGTRLTRITHQLRTRSVDGALDRVSREVQDWSGGTRIGESLRTFNTIWSRRVLRRGAVVLIISDGWDRGDVDLLRREMARLQRSSHRLVWLNPLLGSPTYQPLTRGIQAALPYVDDFLPVHNLNSLEALASNLAGVPDRRPTRRQTPHRMR